MGQKTSTITDTASTINYEVQRHTKLLSELGTLKYEEFQKCLAELNALSRKCIDSNGKQLVFAVSKGTDDTLLWKATVKIACVKVDPETRHVDNYKLLNLKEFLQVWKTFHTHVQSMNASEKQQEEISASRLLDEFDSLTSILNSTTNNFDEYSSLDSPFSECCICLDRRPDVLLPCAHLFCCPCIEQWNVERKSCPICQADLKSTDDTWVISKLPVAEEISTEIVTELMSLSQSKTE